MEVDDDPGHRNEEERRRDQVYEEDRYPERPTETQPQPGEAVGRRQGRLTAALGTA